MTALATVALTAVNAPIHPSQGSVVGWVERSETHQARCTGLVDGFRSLRDSVRCANYAFASLGRCALPIYFEFLLAEGELNQICGKIPPGSVAPGVCK